MLIVLLLLLLLLMQMTMMRGQLLQGRRYLTCCYACAASDSRALALTRARRSTNATTRLWRWSGAIQAMAGVASAVTAWRRFCTTSPPV